MNELAEMQRTASAWLMLAAILCQLEIRMSAGGDENPARI